MTNDFKRKNHYTPRLLLKNSKLRELCALFFGTVFPQQYIYRGILLFRYGKHPYGAVVGQIGLKARSVLFNGIGAVHDAGIHGELHHMVAVLYKKIAESRRLPALGGGLYGKVEKNKYSHKSIHKYAVSIRKAGAG
jgi:hypothetical protein